MSLHFCDEYLATTAVENVSCFAYILENIFIFFKICIILVKKMIIKNIPHKFHIKCVYIFKGNNVNTFIRFITYEILYQIYTIYFQKLVYSKTT